MLAIAGLAVPTAAALIPAYLVWVDRAGECGGVAPAALECGFFVRAESWSPAGLNVGVALGASPGPGFTGFMWVVAWSTYPSLEVVGEVHCEYVAGIGGCYRPLGSNHWPFFPGGDLLVLASLSSDSSGAWTAFVGKPVCPEPVAC